MVTVLLFQILNSLFQHPIQSVLLVVSRYDQCHEHFGIADLVALLNGNELLLGHVLQGDIVVVPTRQELWIGDLSISGYSDVLLFGFPRRSRDGSEEVQEDV